MFYLTTHSTHFIYGYTVIWRQTYGKGPRGLLFPISSKGSSLYATSHREDNTYHGLCYSSRGALAGTRNSSMGPP